MTCVTRYISKSYSVDLSLKCHGVKKETKIGGFARKGMNKTILFLYTLSCKF